MEVLNEAPSGNSHDVIWRGACDSLPEADGDFLERILADSFEDRLMSIHQPPPEIDVGAARRHLHLLTGQPDPAVAWQIFDDRKKDQSVARGFYGTLDEVLPRLRAAQEKGCGVYLGVNQTDGQRRRKENMVAARALFLDLDGAPLPDDWPVRPDLIVHSSSVDGVDKYQCWWRIEPTDDWDTWRRMQMALAIRYGGDVKCTLVTQVGRCAGFIHQKNPAQPWQVRIIHDGNPDLDILPTLKEQARLFGFGLSAVKISEPRQDRGEIKPPPGGFDNPIDVQRAKALVVVEDNWKRTSDGAVSIFQMACRLHDLGLSPDLAIELIEQHVPVLPPQADGDNRYVERKVANAYQYAQNTPGADSFEADRRMLAEKLVDRDALAAFLDKGEDDE
ncbi:MAG: DNA-primase RepB domain-containing protein [Aliihoeflea sp.]